MSEWQREFIKTALSKGCAAVRTKDGHVKVVYGDVHIGTFRTGKGNRESGGEKFFRQTVEKRLERVLNGGPR